MAWSMRGGLDYVDIMNMSTKERNLILKVSKENMEMTSKSGLPFF